MITLIIIFFIIGLCKGICDSIAWHDGYADYGHWWSLGSWKDKKFLGMFVPNAWHIFDITRNTLLFSAILSTIINPVELSLVLILLPLVFLVGFKFFYK